MAGDSSTTLRPTTLWLVVTAGQGPAECELFAFHLVGAIQADAAAAGVACDLAETQPGAVDRAIASALICVEGKGSQELADRWRGTHKWICPSPLRPDCRRKNWFAGVGVLTAPESPTWRESDLRVEAFRSSGPGGQHANKTSSAVRVTHTPTGLVAVAQEERSQHRNRALALARLDALMVSAAEAGRQAASAARWREHAALVRGEEVAIYRGTEFRRET